MKVLPATSAGVTFGSVVAGPPKGEPGGSSSTIRCSIHWSKTWAVEAGPNQASPPPAEEITSSRPSAVISPTASAAGVRSTNSARV